MKAYLDCIPCFLQQSLEASRMVDDNEAVHERVLKEVMHHLQNISFNSTPPELSMHVHSIIKKITGCEDPYKRVKEESNLLAKNLYPKLKNIIDESDDRLLTSLKLAVAGNVVDFGSKERFDVEETIENVLNKNFAIDFSNEFKKALEESHDILYLADNAGEVFFDKLLLEEIQAKVTYAVKSNPIINDALIEDAKFAGIDKIAELMAIDAGKRVSAPGAVLTNSSRDFLERLESADMIISKGQGNYEALSDHQGIFFLLMVKCPLVARDIGVEVGEMVLK